MSYNAPGTYYGCFAHGHTTENRGIRTDRGSALDQGRNNLPVCLRLKLAGRCRGLGVFVIDKHDTVTHEDFVLYGHTLTNERVALDLTVLTDKGIFLNLHERTNLRAIVNPAAVEVDEVSKLDVLAKNHVCSYSLILHLETSQLGWKGGRLEAGNCMTIWGSAIKEYTYDVKYPLGEVDESVPQLTIGHIKLRPGDYLAALDDSEGAFFAHGEVYHMVLDPRTGKPERSVRAAVVVSRDSCLQASIYAYGIMVMGLDRGMEFLDETDGVEGLILTEDHELHASGGLGDRFWM